MRIAILHCQSAVDPTTLWKTIRCRHCGIRISKYTDVYQLYEEQISYLTEMRDAHAIKSLDKCIRVVVDFEIVAGDELAVFGKNFPVRDASITYDAVVSAAAAAAAATNAPLIPAAPVQRSFFGLDQFRSPLPTVLPPVTDGAPSSRLGLQSTPGISSAPRTSDFVIEDLRLGVDGDADDIDAAVALAARAFWDDPLFTYMYRSDQQRRALLAMQFRSYLDGAVPLRAFCIRDAQSGQLVSFAAFVPQPGSQWNEKWDAFMEQHAAACARLEFCDGAAVHARLVDCEKHWSAELMDETYWYLLLLATDPAHHGRGHGRALVAHGKRFAKSAGCGVNLEACNADRGIPFYASQRFQVVSQWQAPHAANRELLHACGCADASSCEHRECSAHLAPVCHYMQVTPEQLRADSSIEPAPE